VPKDIKIPPSLKNIFKELNLEFPERNYNFNHGNLEEWFYRENIFLLNSALTVLNGVPNSHMHIWTEFTDSVIQFISNNNENCIFLLLGNFAINKSKFIKNKNNIITEKHPSPLAHGFIGSNVFKRVEKILNNKINWQN
jgi:uracil-DNA glycosylase